MVIHYFENGIKKKEGTWENGKKYGIFKEWDETGKLIKEENYNSDIIDVSSK
jgi:antitoxin component YwqK of YwqJK toxin-antitoxin module